MKGMVLILTTKPPVLVSGYADTVEDEVDLRTGPGGVIVSFTLVCSCVV